jgi:Zn-dependent protease
MATHTPAVVLLVINIGLLWLLMAVPLGLRTVRVRATFQAGAGRVWSAVSPLGSSADWHHSVLTSRVLPEAVNRVQQTYTHRDRHGQPIVRSFEITERAGGSEYEALVLDDSALDASFWKDFRERRRIVEDGDTVHLTIEQTDRYRGFAFLIFRFFALRREVKALRQWLDTGQSKPARATFEHPLVQCGLALLSTLLLWPFFGLTHNGLMLSALLTVVIVLHELGHMAAYRAFGHKTVRMIFVPLLGGIAIGGRPYNSLFEVATCALMGAGMSAFFIPVAIALHEAGGEGVLAFVSGPAILVFLLILGAFNLLNLLPMNRFDGGQVLRQVFRSRISRMMGSFLVTLVILGVGWRIGISSPALLAGLAVFALLSMMGQGGVKPRHRLDEMTDGQRIVSGLGLYAAVVLHGYAIVYATDRLFS